MKTTSNSGFTLIEILISLVVLSIGLLGVAGMQVVGMKNNHSAYLRTQATLLAYDYADILRTNFNLVYNSSTFDSYTTPSSVTSSAAAACTSSNCNASEMATADLNHWSKSVIDTLPSGAGVISRNGDIFTVTMTWEDDLADLDSSGTTTKTFTTSFRP